MTESTKNSGPKNPGTSGGFNRRDFLKGSGAVAATAALAAQQAEAAEKEKKIKKGKSTIMLNVNGSDHKLTVENRTTLLEALRYNLDLTGAKPVSVSDGSSGASTVLVDGKPMLAYDMLAVAQEGKKIETVESLGGKNPDAVPKAFVQHDAEQCGFCTPGFVVAVRAFLNKNPKATDDDIRKGLNGNLCRCGTYANIIEAAAAVVKGDA